jgi:zinc/manganese transport system permease protein
MLEDFLSTWELFQNAYLVGWLSSVVLAPIGVIVVARNQIFLSAAIAQSSTLGIAIGMLLGGFAALGMLGWLQSDAFLSAAAIGFATLATLTTTLGQQAVRESVEAMTGWIFLFSSSVSILLLAHSPHGLEEIYRLLSSSLIGATRADVWIFATLAALSILGLLAYHRRLLLVVLDPSFAVAMGMRRWVWELLIGTWLGVAVGLSMRSVGMIYTFGCLVLPALAAKHMCHEVRAMLVLAPVVAVASALFGFVFANHYDYPPAQMTAAFLCAWVVAAWAGKRLFSLALFG